MVRRYFPPLLVLLSAVPASALPTSQDDERGLRTVTAARAEGVRVDGVLDEAAWAAAEPALDFVQFEPTEGAPASQPTDVRVLYGADAIYVGAVLYEADPALIRTQLSRRDEIGGGDFFLVAFDSYNDRQTGYEFAVTAGGVQFDAYLDGSEEDDSWDAVWDAAVRVTPEGWVVEMAIPYSQLRFSERDTSWGVNFIRQIQRNGEKAMWSPLRRTEANAGFVQFFGRLEGLHGIRSRRPMQVAPYSLASASTFEHAETPGTMDADYGADVGADLKLGLASNVILDATINPDFGQVEADPAQLNLSTFETFFDERRPFFLEGTGIFDYTIGVGDGSLLYTRRVGAFAPIIGAAKLSGRLPSGLSFGVLGAATGDEFEPGRWYGVARVKQELGTRDYVGGAVTAFESPHRADGTGIGIRTLAAGADWDFRLGADEQFLLEGSLAGAVRDDLDPASAAGADRGYALYVGFDKVKGYFTPGSGLRIYSDRFEINDVGRFQQNDLISARLGGNYLWNEGNPVGPFRRFDTFAGGTQVWRYADGTNRGFNLFFGAGGQLRGFQFLQLTGNLDGVGGYDVRETRGLGPVRNVAQLGINVDFNTDQRRHLVFYPGVFVGAGEDGGRSLSVSAEVDWTASDRLRLSLGVDVGANDDWRAWAANEGLVRTPDGLFIGAEAGEPGGFTADGLHPLDLDAAGTAALLDGVLPWEGPLAIPGATGFFVPVFGRRDVRQASVTARTSVLFRPNLSLQLYGQLFAARGHYDRFQLLAGPDDLRDFDAYPRRRDFAFESFHANAVLRWEYRPGSTLFVVWTQARNGGIEEALLLNPDGTGLPPSPFETGTVTQLRDVFRIYPDNVFLVKLSYLIMR
ncbi:MAG TPA: DUF5916 domain-containing protein [Rubricoccaceae bacterium]|nr:DUF5916 domain-containing protein [Rubricoccaceae bacterium]